ncbi:aminoglycoside 3'-phosphotransferase/choline kinase family protein [Saccharothrix violaceirubra]|uniref:Hygromycin-B 7''-O-kinase n=1 Tax=Saccharothrix violaceirubra TaxID=413306 RepID=A0A7W7WXN2_9PSEU|nr:aminoglycoside 3'-phosphotransferase/choline kinase family protein [Saccharothrix violaceirubra]MBB4967550.1 hygromycin-B 7''-O-kinase [Saccharothrix violaceirubra]
MTFPLADTEERFEAVVDDESALRPGVDRLLGRLDLRGEPVRYPDGSLPVYRVGEHVLKLFPAVHLEELPTERDVLRAVHGRLPVPTPAVREAGEVDGWGYVLMERLRGTGLVEVWPTLDAAGRESVARQVGEALAVLHDLPSPVDHPADWSSFVAARRVAPRRPVDPAWADRVDEFLDRVDLGADEPVLAHTEVMSAHLLVEGTRLTGLIDFEPAMRAAREYEFVATGIFLTRGDQAANRALYTGYGRPVDPLRVMAYTLLHVYSNLAWYLREVPPPADVDTLDALARHWFGSAPVRPSSRTMDADAEAREARP